MDGEALIMSLNAAAFGALMASGGFAFFARRKAKRTLALLAHVQEDIDRALAAAGRVLQSPDVTAEPREAILILLHGLAHREFGTWLLTRLSSAEPDLTREKSSLAKAIDEIREENPAIADDIDFAMVGISNLALPMAYRVGEVTEIAAQTPTSERRVINFVGSILRMKETATDNQLSFNV